jgi:uncharacterized protein (TIGR03118 family)
MSERSQHIKSRGKSSKFKINNLISNLAAVAKKQDVNLINSWGIIIHRKIIWVADNGSHLITNYDLNGNSLYPGIVIPPSQAAPELPGNPTGIVINSSKGFVISKGGKSASSYLLAATENGTIVGYNAIVDPLNAITVIDNSVSGAVYKGIALSDTNLFAVDFFNNKVDVYDYDFNLVTLPPLAFVDLHPTYPIPSSFAPFNIVRVKDLLYVMYARQNPPDNTDNLAGAGSGFVSAFDLSGNFVKRLISGGKLNSPWGFILAPRDFGKFSNNFLISNFGDGKINGYDSNGRFLGTVKNKDGTDVVLDGLWGLFPLGRYLFFASGPNGETNGLVGNIKKI